MKKADDTACCNACKIIISSKAGNIFVWDKMRLNILPGMFSFINQSQENLFKKTQTRTREPDA